MVELKTHWTERTTEDFLYKLASDFVRQIETIMERDKTSQAALARNLGVSEGRVSQVLNNPGNITLRNIVQYARALGRKVSVVTYDDGDPDNERGPVNAEIFTVCWERAGRPADFFALDEASTHARFVIVSVGESNQFGDTKDFECSLGGLFAHESDNKVSVSL